MYFGVQLDTVNCMLAIFRSVMKTQLENSIRCPRDNAVKSWSSNIRRACVFRRYVSLTVTLLVEIQIGSRRYGEVLGDILEAP